MSVPSTNDRIRVATYAPPEHLADVVATFWLGVWDLDDPHTTELLSDPCPHFVFERSNGPDWTSDTHGARLVGVWTRLWTRTLRRRGRAVGVKLHPGALRAFVADDADRFSDRITPLTEVFGENAATVEARIGALDEHEAIFDAVAAWLDALRRDDDDVELAVRLVATVTSDEAMTSVMQLSEESGLSVRDLQRLFRTHVGGTPKWVIRRHRLQEVALRIERGDPGTLADLAASLGYADHAHLARDFKNAVGKSPSAFRRSLERAAACTKVDPA